MSRNRQLGPIRTFKARGNYVIGVLQKNADPNSYNPSFRKTPATLSGKALRDRFRCRTLDDFFEQNPLRLPPQTVHIFAVQPDGSRKYVGEGTPQRVIPGIPGAGLNDYLDTPQPVAAIQPGDIVPRHFYTEDREDYGRNQKSDGQTERHVSYLEERLRDCESRLEHERQITAALQDRLREAEIKATMFEKLYESEKSERTLEHRVRTEVESQAEKIIKEEQGKGGGLSDMVGGIVQALPTLISLFRGDDDNGKGTVSTPPSPPRQVPQPQTATQGVSGIIPSRRPPAPSRNGFEVADVQEL